MPPPCVPGCGVCRQLAAAAVGDAVADVVGEVDGEAVGDTPGDVDGDGDGDGLGSGDPVYSAKYTGAAAPGSIE
jgi:hypothetical protein